MRSLYEGDVSVILPAWNEAQHIADTAQAIRAWLPVAEIVVADDGSEDETADVAGNLPGVKVVTGPHCGKGAALRRGIAATTGSTVAWLDADGDIDPCEFAQLLSAYQAGSVLCGTKVQGGRPVGRRVVSLVLALAVLMAFSLPVLDTQTGLKILPGEWVRRAAPQVGADGFLFDLEIVARAHREGLPIWAAPVRLASPHRNGRIGLRAVLASSVELARVWTRVVLSGRSEPAVAMHSGSARSGREEILAQRGGEL